MSDQRLKDVGNRVRYFRESAGLSQEELALKSGFKGKSSISLIELGKASLTEQKIGALAKALGVEESMLRYGENLNNSYNPSDIVFTTDDLKQLPSEEAQAVMRAYNRVISYYKKLAEKMKEGDSE